MSRNTENNIIFKSLQEVDKIKNDSLAPAGYAVIKLSTKGKMGAPEVFHIRNFKVGEILALSLTDDTDLPIRLIEILNDMILEDVDVGNWHEKEVEELMVYLYSIFYKDNVEDINFPYNKEDVDYVRSLPDGDQKAKDIIEGKFVPKASFSITQDVSTYDIPDNFKSSITITKKATDTEDPFKVTFGYVKYRDQILVKAWIDNFFKEDEIAFKEISNKISHNAELQTKYNETSDLSILNSLNDISFEEEQAFKSFNAKKLQVLSEILRIITIIDYNGEDISNLSLSEKYEKLANDPMISYGMIQKLNNRQNKMKFGIKPEVSMINPFTKKPCLRRFSFRPSAIIYAMQISGADNYDDGYDDED